MVSMLRLQNAKLSSNTGADAIGEIDKKTLDDVTQLISERAWKVNHKAAGEHTKSMILNRLDRWKSEASRGGRRLGYDKRSAQGDVVELLKKPGIQSWNEFTTPMSMREVEPGVKLVMDDRILTDSPAWKMKKRKEGEDDYE
jgi:hypothetical protein